MAAQNYSESSSLYTKLIGLETDNQKTLEEEKAKLEKKLVKGNLSAEDYHKVYMELMDIQEAITECKTNQAEWNNKIREIEIQRFDDVLDAIKHIADESSSLIDILSFEDLFKDKGEITDAGMATFGLYAGNYNIFAETLSEYAEEYKRWKKIWENDPTKENYDNMLKYQNLMQESTKSMLDNKKAIYDLVKEGYDLQIEAMEELVDKEKELLDKEKERYDWEKNIGDKNKNIDVLKAQIAELSLSDDRADIAQRLKLEQQLAEAIEDRDDALYEHDIDLKKEEWDEKLKDFKDGIEKYLSDKDLVVSNVIDALNDPENIEKVKAGFKNIAEAGCIVSEDILSIWNNEKPVKAYRDTVETVLTGPTGVTSSIKKVSDAFDNMYKLADNKADEFRIYKPKQYKKDKELIDDIGNAFERILEIINNMESKRQNIFDTMKSIGVAVGNETSIVDDILNAGASVGSTVRTTGLVGNAVSTAVSSASSLVGNSKVSEIPENNTVSKKKAKLISELKSYGVSDNKIEKMYDELKPSKMYNTNTASGQPKYTSDLISLLKKYDVKEDRIKQIKKATFSTGGILEGGRYKFLGEDGLFLGKNGESVMTQEFTKLLPSAIDTMDKFTKMDYVKPVHNVQTNTAPPQVTFAAPLFYVQGNTDENVLKEVRTMMKNEVPDIIGRAWKTSGRRI